MSWLLLWKYKYWIAIAVLSFICVGQLAYTNKLSGQIIKADAEKTVAVAKAIKPYQDAIDQAKTDAATTERIYSENLLKAE
ncbi:hypothetical protein EC844_105141 [Acinetobacter calcoaceticus]|uniref:Uncharacterized protein n=1 Tax=Acinetobacter calcoaceticus TaxID=471 RepID=A0A4R1XV69_ACICA|nr:hypothetical protein EC844_105141 [Acinetobacter calcoaceticus]